MYWLVSLPLDGSSPDTIWSRLQEISTYTNDYSVNFKFKLPDMFRVGTLDSLMALSDELIKVNSAVESTVNKVRRQLYELQASLPAEDKSDIWVEGMTPETYLQRFTWNEAKYPSRRPLKDTVTAIAETIGKLDDDLKLKTSDYMQLKSILAGHMRKHTGSLAVREISSLLPPSKAVDTEHLTTLLTVVPRSSTADWLSKYENLSDFVVPRSSLVVAEDSDYVVFTVVLFKRVVDSFKTAARAAGFQVKDSSVSQPVVESKSHSSIATVEDIDKLQAELESRARAMESWCLTSYGEAFSGWVHVTAVRLFVESVLRYGLPPQFAPVVMRPIARYASKLRKLLATHFGGVGGEHFTGEGGTEEMFPYVSFSLNIDDAR